MKILITYYTQTGTTEEMALKIKEVLEPENIFVQNIADTDPTLMNDYDLVFLGTGVYANGISGKLKKFLKSFPDEIAVPIAIFVGHANPDEAYYGNAIKVLEKLIQKKNGSIIDKCDYIGENRDGKVVEMLLKSVPELHAKNGTEQNYRPLSIHY